MASAAHWEEEYQLSCMCYELIFYSWDVWLMLVPNTTWKTLTYFFFHLEVLGVNNNYTRLGRWFPVLQSRCPRVLDRKLTAPYLSQMQPQVFSRSCIPHNSYCNTSHAVPLHIRMFNMLWPCGHFANKSVGDGMGFLEMPPPQTLTEKPSGPILHQSGVGRSLWPPNRKC